MIDFKKVKNDLIRKGSIYWTLFFHIALVMMLFSVCRIGFYLFNAEFFSEMTFGNFINLMLGGLRFDLTAVLYTNVLFILMMLLPFPFRSSKKYQKVAMWIFFITNSIALAANVADFIYFKFTLRRTTADVFKQFENEVNISGLLFQFLVDYWYALLFWMALVFILVKPYNLLKIKEYQIKNRLAYYVTGSAIMLVFAGLVVAGMRGGFRESTRPITLSNAGEYVKDPKEVSIVLNTPFAIMRTLNHTKIQTVNFFAKAELDSIYSPVHHAKGGFFRKDNVVVIILESFSKEFIGAFNKEKEKGNYKGYTPFLDSLIQFSRSYEFSFSNGRKSIDGLPSVVSSIPSLGVPYFLSPYSGNKINSLASLLKDEGYHSSFFHGAPNGSMGFQAFMNLAGFQEYFGMTEYGNNDDFDGLWGIWDEKFLDYYAHQLNKFPQPFVSALFSVSSHHPFKIPQEYEEKFKGGREPILKCVEYTDYSLKKFFNQASRMPWYDSTLFVITADHCSSNILFDETRTAWGFYSVPIIFFKPDHSLAGRKSEIAQQIDIMPTVLNYLHYTKDYVAYGRDAFDENEEPFAFNYRDNVYQLFVGDYLLVFDGVNSVALYNFKVDRMITTNLLSRQPEIVAGMEKKVKAIIQQYNNRLVENRMTIN